MEFTFAQSVLTATGGEAVGTGGSLSYTIGQVNYIKASGIGGTAWNDFSDDLKYIHLSGHRNKSGRNRIVPVPSYIRDVLVRGERLHNIFSNQPQPLNKDYFKTLWHRFKKQSNVLEQGQTLYSFRHSGAIEIFKRTGSITKLQKAIGHSSINVSLTYLRGLKIAELKEEDMPMI